MDSVMLVEALDEHGNVQQRQRFRGAGATCRIGRSLACEITLDDAFAAAEHARLTLQPGGKVLVQDLGTRNGTRLGGRRIGVDGEVIGGGDVQIGRTRVRVRTTGAALAEERVFRRDLLQRHQTAIAVLGVALCLAFALLQAWVRSPGQVAPRALVAVLLAMLVLATWSGAWALVSRLTVGAWLLRIHLALAAMCVALWAWGYWLYTLAAFAMQWRWLGPATAAIAAVVAYVVTWRHLRYATHLTRAAVLAFAMLAPLLCGGLWWLADLQLDPRSVNRIEQGPRILPPGYRIAPSVDLGDYLSDVAELKREASRSRQQSLLEAPILDEED